MLRLPPSLGTRSSRWSLCSPRQLSWSSSVLGLSCRPTSPPSQLAAPWLASSPRAMRGCLVGRLAATRAPWTLRWTSRSPGERKEGSSSHLPSVPRLSLPLSPPPARSSFFAFADMAAQHAAQAFVDFDTLALTGGLTGASPRKAIARSGYGIGDPLVWPGVGTCCGGRGRVEAAAPTARNLADPRRWRRGHRIAA